jgi:hypothetical protein
MAWRHYVHARLRYLGIHLRQEVDELLDVRLGAPDDHEVAA